MIVKEKWAGAISNGEHLLSGFENVTFETWGEELDGLLLLLDGNYYLIYRDPDDGYRSYGVIEKISDLSRVKTKVINTFEPQKVMAYSFHETGADEDCDYICRDINCTRLINGYGDLIFEVSTDYGEDYYPCGHFEWHPENLPANIKQKTN